MNQSKRSVGKGKAGRSLAVEAEMSQRELAALGGGRIAYIKMLSSDQAKEMYPSIEDLPPGLQLYALQAADGTPIALTDSLQAAMGHARGDELEVASVH
jgi:hypothetical protein